MSAKKHSENDWQHCVAKKDPDKNMDNFMEVIEQLAKKIHLSSNWFKSNVQVSEKKVIKSKISTLEGSFLISLLYNFSVWPQSQAKPKSQASFVLFQIDSNKFSRLILSQSKMALKMVFKLDFEHTYLLQK